MIATEVTTENPPISFTPEQWQGLARLGELVHGFERAFDETLGAAFVEYVAQILSTAPPHSLDAVHELLDLLVRWHEDGLISRIGSGVELITSILSSKNINAVSPAALTKARDYAVPEALRHMVCEAPDTGPLTTRLGGWSGLIRLMTDKDVQPGIKIMSAMAPSWECLGSLPPPRDPPEVLASISVVTVR